MSQTHFTLSQATTAMINYRRAMKPNRMVILYDTTAMTYTVFDIAELGPETQQALAQQQHFVLNLSGREIEQLDTLLTNSMLQGASDAQPQANLQAGE